MRWIKISKKEKNEIPIYEKIGPGECLIISRTDKNIIVACNKNGEIEVKKISYPKEED